MCQGVKRSCVSPSLLCDLTPIDVALLIAVTDGHPVEHVSNVTTETGPSMCISTLAGKTAIFHLSIGAGGADMRDDAPDIGCWFE
jgi:hypothetical protein